MVATSSCPGCGRRLRVDEGLVGKRCRCPACKKAFTVSTIAFPGPASIAPSLEASETLNASMDAVSQRTGGGVPSQGPVLLGKLGRFELREVLGQGGFGTVYRAYDPVLDRDVALKVPRFTADQERKVARFLREAKAAARLNHPNIAAVFDAGEESGSPYFVMEYVAGTDLATLVHRSGPLPLETAVRYVIQAARGLEHAHKNNTVHRDVKPSNLMLDGEGTVKILDMGLARAAQAAKDGESERKLGPQDQNVRPGAERGSSSDRALTMDGQMMGTVDYMAPEQAADAHSADERADIYSLGCTLWTLLVGRPLYESDSIVQRVLAHRDSEIPSLTDVRPEAWPILDVAIKRMVAKNKEDRFASMGEVIAELEAALAAGNAPAKAETSPTDASVTVSSPGAQAKAGSAECGLPAAGFRALNRRRVLIGAALLGLGICGILPTAVYRFHASSGTTEVAKNEPLEAQPTSGFGVGAAPQVQPALGAGDKVQLSPPMQRGVQASTAATADSGMPITAANRDNGLAVAPESQPTAANESEPTPPGQFPDAAEEAAAASPSSEPDGTESAVATAEDARPAVADKPDSGPVPPPGTGTSAPAQALEPSGADGQVVDPVRATEQADPTGEPRAGETPTGGQPAKSPGMIIGLQGFANNNEITSQLIAVAGVADFVAMPPTQATQLLSGLDTSFAHQNSITVRPPSLAAERGRAATLSKIPVVLRLLTAETYRDQKRTALEFTKGQQGRVLAVCVSPDALPDLNDAAVFAEEVKKCSPGTRFWYTCNNLPKDTLEKLSNERRIDSIVFSIRPLSQNEAIKDIENLREVFQVAQVPTEKVILWWSSGRADAREKGRPTPAQQASPGTFRALLTQARDGGFGGVIFGDCSMEVENQEAGIASRPDLVKEIQAFARELRRERARTPSYRAEAARPTLNNRRPAGGRLSTVEPSKPIATARVTSLLDKQGKWKSTVAPGPAIAPFDETEAKRRQVAWASYLGVPVEIVNELGMTFVLMPPGEFQMGTNSADVKNVLRDAQKTRTLEEWELERLGSEVPQHRVVISRPFYFGKHHLTTQQFERFVGATGFKTSAETNNMGTRVFRGEKFVFDPQWNWRNCGQEQPDSSPALCLSWSDATVFCRWTSEAGKGPYRLPTEAEWEYVCRAGTTTPYYFGDDSSRLPEFCRDVGDAIDAKPANPWGVHGLIGLPTTWCSDWWSAYTTSDLIDPKGPAQGTVRVMRARGDPARPLQTRSAWRSYANPDDVRDVCGVRVVFDPFRVGPLPPTAGLPQGMRPAIESESLAEPTELAEDGSPEASDHRDRGQAPTTSEPAPGTITGG